MTRPIIGPMAIQHEPDSPDLWVLYDGTKRVSQHETREAAEDALFSYSVNANESDVQLERRLAREAQETFLGSMGDPETATDVCRVEVSYQETWESSEHCGHYKVYVNARGDEHPANLASDAVYARSRHRNDDYFQVDDVYPW